MITVGEKINGTRKSVKTAVERHDADFMTRLVQEQDVAGADYIDLNVGTGMGGKSREADDMKWLIDVALAATKKHLCIDSADPAVLHAASEHLGGRRKWMLNSVKGDNDSLESLLPIVQEWKIPFVALAMDRKGIANHAWGRVSVCENIHLAVVGRGIDPALIFFDPLVIPLVTDVTQAVVTCECIREIKDTFPECNTILGLSNISHGLPKRALINQGFLAMAMASGLDAAIVDPTDGYLRKTVVSGNALAGRDSNCRKYARAYRNGLLD